MSQTDEIRTRALSLPQSDRALLARDLLLSLETDAFDADVEAEWAEEVESRAEAVARGEMALHDWREAIERLRRNLVERRRP